MDKIAIDDFQHSYQKLHQERLIHRKEAFLEVLEKTRTFGEIILFESIKSKRGV
ncbi:MULTISPECIES: hypothetical protein [Lysinibacillus]|uniref:Uncharacterized protein n=1 Tax=Lysinibacillus capsici TaxID=2115968 RepID=A0A2X1BPF4_9BACI|nr:MULTISPECIES: hypothetical protein [Lysinibacillus]MCM0624464.1 hypothetical protein [Lysinibacillus sp. OL1_EC]MCR6521311.1 hypothetical protein [Lysinibacillus capsici]MCS5500826.1 hypothetical protein [Lysinibacillus sp. A4]MCT1538071.1 hypothetical protein [Lysinibacillus capsici]MCT1570150.1 hypothetical protein [Lysinibacillus capsici]